MKVGIVGSRSLTVENMEDYLPKECIEIISGGAKGVDSCAAEYARTHNIRLTEILPEYKKYGKAAPIVRNKEIVEKSDLIIAFWDGKSAGTKSVIEYCKKISREYILVKKDNE